MIKTILSIVTVSALSCLNLVGSQSCDTEVTRQKTVVQVGVKPYFLVDNIKGIFSDWPTTVSFYANCKGL